MKEIIHFRTSFISFRIPKNPPILPHRHFSYILMKHLQNPIAIQPIARPFSASIFSWASSSDSLCLEAIAIPAVYEAFVSFACLLSINSLDWEVSIFSWFAQQGLPCHSSLSPHLLLWKTLHWWLDQNWLFSLVRLRACFIHSHFNWVNFIFIFYLPWSWDIPNIPCWHNLAAISPDNFSCFAFRQEEVVPYFPSDSISSACPVLILFVWPLSVHEDSLKLELDPFFPTFSAIVCPLLLST